jgi:LEA14-like dessication related protein
MPPERGQLGLATWKVTAVVVGLLVASLVGAVAVGVLGAPTVEDVENRFGEVTNETTVVHTDLVVHNPNPVGIRLGDTEINYTVRMNGVPMAEGGGVGLNLRTGNSTQQFTTEMDNDQIPPWWRSHVNADERTVVTINATVRTSVLGERQFDVTQEREIETDIIGQFNSEETRPVEAENPPPTASNPILYVNRTAADWGQATERRTPIDMQFVVFNPQLEPYVVTELGYEITMNDVQVGEGRSQDNYVIPGGGTGTLETTTFIRNDRLDEWWVTHLRNDQVTDLRIEFYALVELPTGQSVRVPLDELTYEETIETDIFGTKNASGADGADRGTPTDDSSETPTADGETTATPTPTPTSSPTSTPTPTATDEDDGIGL